MTLPENRPLKRVENRIAEGWWHSADVGPGWHQIILELDAKLAELFPDYRIHQVKEKFGSLRYYTEPVPSELYDQWQTLIRNAELKSIKTCEVCGEPGDLSGDTRWIRTLCEKHLAEHKAAEEKLSEL